MRALSLFAVTLAVNIPSSLLTTPKPFECLPGWTEEHRRGGGHVCGRNGGHWMCPKEWFKTNHPPFCVSEPIDNKLVKSTAGPSAVHRAMELRAELSKCGLVRFSYSCHGPDYDAWIIAHMIELEKSRHTFEVMLHRGALNSKKNSTDDAKPLNLLTKGPVLFLGGSHQGQLAEGLMCALVHGARRVLATDMTTGCLADFSEKGVETINCHGNASCGMYLARMELHKGVNGPDGGTILLANNHPWLFQGASGMDKALRHLLLSEGPFMEEAQDSSSKSRHAQGGTAHPRSLGSRAWTPSELGPKADLSQLGAIFLGEWNPKFWAEKVFRPSTEDVSCCFFFQSKIPGIHPVWIYIDLVSALNRRRPGRKQVNRGARRRETAGVEARKSALFNWSHGKHPRYSSTWRIEVSGEPSSSLESRIRRSSCPRISQSSKATLVP